MLKPIIDFFVTYAPLFAALGLFHLGAAGARAAWGKIKIAAGASPTKVDDFLIHVADGPITAAIALFDAGDMAGVKQKLDALKSLVPTKGPQA